MGTRNYKLICITGPIGVGKTTCAESLARPLRARRVSENLAENTHLKAFYNNMEEYALRTQMEFLLGRSRQLATLGAQGEPGTVFVADFHFAKERIFAELVLKDHERAVYDENYASVAASVPKADAVVYLKAPGAALMANIRKRGRAYERNIDPAYVERVADAYEKAFGSFSESPLLTVSAEGQDFTRGSSAVADIAAWALDTIGGRGPAR